MRVRAVLEADVAQVLDMIRELAAYERLAHEVVATRELLRRHLFGERPIAEAAIAEVAPATAGGEADGTVEPVGFALWYTSFSTFTCRPGIWVEDLFVRPGRRGRGVGRALLQHVAQLALQRDCARLELAALDWNEPALGFYRSLGARQMDDWRIQRLEGDALRRLAGS